MTKRVIPYRRRYMSTTGDISGSDAIRISGESVPRHHPHHHHSMGALVITGYCDSRGEHNPHPFYLPGIIMM